MFHLENAGKAAGTEEGTTPHCVGPILHPENLLIMGSVPLKAFQTHVLQAPESLTPLSPHCTELRL